MANADTGNLWANGAIAVVAILAPITVGALVYLRAADLQRFDERCEEMRGVISDIRHVDEITRTKLEGALGTIAENRISQQRHDKEASRRQDMLDRLNETVNELKTVATSRPDPFTGTDGRKLERRIQGLEYEVKALRGQINGGRP